MENMRRYGETIKNDIYYKTRISVYGIITVGSNILLTEQDGDEIQLPGGGVDSGEYKSHALIREAREETGWKIIPSRHLGTYQRYAFMPEYDMWAHKVCHIYHCQGIYPVSRPTEIGHIPFISAPETALKLIPNEGEKAFIRRFFKI